MALLTVEKLFHRADLPVVVAPAPREIVRERVGRKERAWWAQHSVVSIGQQEESMVGTAQYGERSTARTLSIVSIVSIVH